MNSVTTLEPISTPSPPNTEPIVDPVMGRKWLIYASAWLPLGMIAQTVNVTEAELNDFLQDGMLDAVCIDRLITLGNYLQLARGVVPQEVLATWYMTPNVLLDAWTPLACLRQAPNMLLTALHALIRMYRT